MVKINSVGKILLLNKIFNKKDKIFFTYALARVIIISGYKNLKKGEKLMAVKKAKKVVKKVAKKKKK